MKQQKKAVIDIDNTLWHFCDVLFERLQKINQTIPPPDGWVEWDFWENYCSKEEFLGAIKDIHLKQDDDRHLPYPEAKEFLATLKKNDFHIIIASHRTPDSIEETHRWLAKHDLVFDEVHLSYDKTVLINSSCHAVVDDAPHILDHAALRSITAAGLMFSWNLSHANNGYKLCKDLNEVLRYILLP
jgi:phosphoglycolate phosphatase-like HAD superfamily hydrolase